MEIKNYCPSARYFLVALKKDLRDEPGANKEDFVSKEQGESIAKKINAEKFFECSALKRINVNEVFEAAAQNIYYNQENKMPADACGISKCCGIFRCCN